MKTKVSLPLIAVFGVVGTLSAKTVALWTMDPTVMPDGRKLLRCAVSPHNDLLLGTHTYISSSDQTIGWNLPPNPDTSEDFVLSTVSRKCVTSSGVHNQTFFTWSDDSSLIKAVSPQHDFTVEGWMNISQFPADPSGSGRVLLFAGTNGRGSYSLQICANSGDSLKRDIKLVFRNGVATGGTFCSLDNADMQNSWHHYAFTFKLDNGTGNSIWKFFVDGVEKGSLQHGKINNVAVDNRFLFGGATTSDNRGSNIIGSFDYWRVSDQVLEASQFLCAGGAGTIVTNHKTLAYWKFGRNSDGSVDARDYVGTADLSQGFYTNNTNYEQNASYGICSIRPSVESHDGYGSAKCLAILGTAFQHPSLGVNLSFDKSFSVEGWIKPFWRGRASAHSYICGTLDSYSDACSGWLLILQKNENGYRFLVGAQDGTGQDTAQQRGNLTQGSSGFQNAAVISPYYPIEEQWKKISLRYAATSAGGSLWNGTWSLYVDDELAGTASHAKTYDASVRPTNKAFECFFIGGASKGGACHGLFDDWRVSNATDEIAHWPLNVLANGVDMDVTDTHGNYSFAPIRNICVAANAANYGPTVSNPDTTITFDGNPTSTSGSVRISSTQNVKGYLAAYDYDLSVALKSTSEWTLEGWINWDGTFTDRGWGIIFAISTGTVPSKDPNWNSPFMLRTNYEGGMSMVDNLFSVSDSLSGSFASSNKLPKNEWKHFALVHTVVGTTSRYELFINGTSWGTYSGTAKSPSSPTQFLVGGSPGQDIGGSVSNIRTFPGSVSSFRLTDAALSPSEFLCASNSSPSSDPLTLVYWPLDNNSGAVDGNVAFGKDGYEMFLGGTGATGQTAKARKSLKDANLPSANNGSVVVGNEPLSADYIGLFMEPDSHAPWSVEGYYKNSVGGMVCRMGYSGCGWQLDYDPSESQFSLVASPNAQCSPCAVGTFSAVAVDASGWNHLLLTFDPSGSLPVWSLYVNGIFAGNVTSSWSGAYADYYGLFSLGSGEFDMWRVSHGIVTVPDSLYRTLPGTVIIFR